MPRRDAWSRHVTRRGGFVAIALVVAACGTSAPSPSPAPPAPTALATAAPPTAAQSTQGASAIPAGSPGFAFDPESIVGYYQSIGFQCAERQPSTTAAGFEFQSCQLVDAAGRTVTLGSVTDPEDSVADAFLSVRGAAGETVLDPADVLDEFAAFLGAFLGEAQGTELLPWLAAHLGDADARTTVGDLTIATYTDAPDDHAKLTLEIATQAYLDAPRPN